MTYGYRDTNRKIDLYRVHRNGRGRIVRTEYICSTNWSRTCREAVERFIASGDNVAGLLPHDVKAQFA